MEVGAQQVLPEKSANATSETKAKTYIDKLLAIVVLGAAGLVLKHHIVIPSALHVEIL